MSSKAARKVVAMVIEESEVPLKVGVSFAIFLLSFLAVAFPAISKRVRYLRIPSLVFFVGKHFGTGVILSTAFVHLLPDSFNALKSKWTGFIILASLLSIFLVEYITTAYVDHLQSYSSAPPSPSHSPSRSSSRTRDLPADTTSIHEQTPLLDPSRASTVRTGYAVVAEEDGTSDRVPVVEVCPSPRKSLSHASLIQKAQAAVTDPDEEIIFGGAHHRHESRNTHASHSLPPTMGKAGGVTVGKKVAAVVLYDEDSEEERNKKKQMEEQSRRRLHNHHHHHPQSQSEASHPHLHHSHGHAHLDMENWHNDEDSDHEDGSEIGEEVKVGRRRQIVGILILQIGIMLHSLVIGLTMSVSSGSEFTTLVTAILFHQIFEGLSLGIRIAALPSETKHGAFARLPGHVLKPLLTLTFALTTPTGLWIGLAAFSSTTSPGSPQLKQMQGVLSATSAGMLIYAACVEMLAGDFVMDPMMWRSGLKRQMMALVSLVLGVAAMSAIE